MSAAILRRLALVAGLAVLAAACMRPLPGPPGLALATDGTCVVQPGRVVDPDTGEVVPVQRRFCGGPARVAQ